MRDTERERGREAETQAEGEAAPCREPDVGLDPRTPGSRPGPKADAQPLGNPGIPITDFKTTLFIMIHLIKFRMTTVDEINVLLPISTHSQIAALYCHRRKKETYGSL